MDDPIQHHQRQLNGARKRIDLVARHDSKAAARLRAVHQKVSEDFARLRRAFADDWNEMRGEAHAGLRELHDEMGALDATLTGWYEEELRMLDQSLDDLTSELERAHADDQASVERRLDVDAAGLAELRAQIAQAKRRRDAVGAAPPAEQRAAVDGYAAAVQQAIESWRRHNQRKGELHGDLHPEV